VCDLETSRMGAPYIYDISHLRVNVINYIFMFYQLIQFFIGFDSPYLVFFCGPKYSFSVCLQYQISFKSSQVI